MLGAEPGRRSGADAGSARAFFDGEPPVRGSHSEHDATAYWLGYLMGPAALVVILVLQHFGVVAHMPFVRWLAVFLIVPAASGVADIAAARNPTRFRLQARVIVHSGLVAGVIYLTGWGPVASLAFVIVALANMTHNGSWMWRTSLVWSVIAIAVGQVAVGVGWAPSFLSTEQAQTLGLINVFVLAFVVRMAGATMEQKEQAESEIRANEERFRALVQNSSDTIVVVDPEGVVSYASPATMTLLGRPPEDVVGQVATELIHPDDRQMVRDELAARFLTAGGLDAVEIRMTHTDGTVRTVEAVINDLRSSPSVGAFVVNLRDATERIVARELLSHRAAHDPLTGLANRALILDRAEQMLGRSVRAPLAVAALFVDLDNFKDVNDTLGHEVGDQLLCAVARRFSSVVRSGETVGRLGGDEFVVLAEGMSLAAGPEILAQRLHEVLRQPIEVDAAAGTPLTVTASIGIACGSRSTAEELLRDADIALYRAKAAGRNRTALFAPEMHSAILDRLALKLDLQTALAAGQFHLDYQPLFELGSMQTYGVEALLRWQHPTRGLIGPAEFVPLLEESGLIFDVGEWVLVNACRQAADWHASGRRLVMSVNASVRQVEQAGFVDQVRAVLVSSGLDPGALQIEITETALMRDVDATIARLAEIKALGASIAIDDFGTGYSSLGYLRQFPVDALKIDQTFIAAMDDTPESTAFIHAMVALAQALGIDTIAEGIEEPEQLEALRVHGCRRGQGSLVSRPRPAAEISQLLGVSAPARS